jgi:hypothetical protein
MRSTERIQISGTLGLFLLSLPLLHGAWTRYTAAPRSGPTRQVTSTAARPPFEAALREAVAYRIKAHRIVRAEIDALEAWDPEAGAGLDWTSWGQPRLSADRSGYLHRARVAGLRADALARTPVDAYRAAMCLAYLEHDAGHHQAELRQARRLMALQPRQDISLAVLQRAALCNELPALARQAEAALAAVERRRRASMPPPMPPNPHPAAQQ